jgi:predicted alpha/beta superfamily hydrolase
VLSFSRSIFAHLHHQAQLGLAETPIMPMNISSRFDVKGIIVLVLVCFSCSVSWSQDEPVSELEPIQIGVVDHLYSDILGEEREIWVHTPESGLMGEPGDIVFPVVYVLDGRDHFHSVVGMIHRLSSGSGGLLCPEMIVVGIANTDRMRDLTPTHVDALFGDISAVATSGGGENFTQFLREELIPHIDANYATNSYRTLIGHSLGGLMVMNTLFHHSDLFANYISIDASMWYDDRDLLKQFESRMSGLDLEGKSLFLSIANTMEVGMDISTVEQDTTEESDHIRSLLKLADLLESDQKSGLKSDWKYYPDDSHGSVPFISEYDALRSLFDWMDFDLQVIYRADSTTNTIDLVSSLSDHYAGMSKVFEYEILPGEFWTNSVGYHFLEKADHDKSHAFFNLNITNYPESANCYDSMGDYYSETGDAKQAIAFYSKALELFENPESRSKMEELQKGEK